MVARGYVPQRGDIVWLNFSPQAGHEQAGLRPAIVLSTRNYNVQKGLALFCPVTSKIKGFPFEVELDTDAVQGVILADAVKNLDWRTRGVVYAGKVPNETLEEVTARLSALIGGTPIVSRETLI